MQKESMLKILVICTGNSARSQMTEGFLKHYKKDWQVYSEGTIPTGLNPLAVEAMSEKGIDISNTAIKCPCLKYISQSENITGKALKGWRGKVYFLLKTFIISPTYNL